jgi:AcrR family transcriptional regulator
VAAPDPETRKRLLAAATRLFAERGFHHVTVRQICRAARANLASINYHFGGKEGLYREILGTAIDAMRRTHQEGVEAGAGLPPDARLRAHIRVLLGRLLAPGRDALVHQILLRETAEPTPALDLVVERGMAPPFRYLAELVAELLGCEVADERVARGVTNVRALCFAYVPNPFAVRLRAHVPAMWRVVHEPAGIDALAAQIASFALAGLRSMAVGQTSDG